jgi:hypothetical protein
MDGFPQMICPQAILLSWSKRERERERERGWDGIGLMEGNASQAMPVRHALPTIRCEVAACLVPLPPGPPYSSRGQTFPGSRMRQRAMGQRRLTAILATPGSSSADRSSRRMPWSSVSRLIDVLSCTQRPLAGAHSLRSALKCTRTARLTPQIYKDRGYWSVTNT